MSSINTNVSSLIAVNALNTNQANLQTSLQRLSTGYRINSGADDPAGLIAASSLTAAQTATTAAISNAQRADNIVGTADGALSEVGNLLVSLQSLVSNSANTAGLSQDEKNANQLQVDSILSTVNRISGAASFEGTKLLNGTFDYKTSGLANTTSAFTNVNINSAQVGSSTLGVTVKVVTSAQTGQLNFLGSSVGLANAATVSITGNTGSVQLSFASATKSSAIVASINQSTASTGVKAVLSTDSKSVKLLSSGYGSDQFVSVTSSNTGAFSTKNTSAATATTASGRNANLSVNGIAVTSSGLSFQVSSPNLDANFTLNSSANTTGASKTFGITGGGATFMLGAQVNTANQATLSFGTVDNSHLGQTLYNGKSYSLSDLGSGGAAAVNTGDTTLAQNIVTQSISDVANLRARLGAFQTNVVGSTINSLNVALENTASSLSAVQDTNFATETANMTRGQILTQAATSVLSQANQAPSSVLKLLG